jgi:outer membrane protein
MKFFIAALSLTFCVHSAFANDQKQDLLTLAEQAQSENPKIVSASLANKFAEHKERESFGRLLPQASFDTSRSFNQYESNNADYDYYGSRSNLVITQQLFNLPAWYEYKKSSQLNEKSSHQKISTNQEQTNELLIRYLEVLKSSDSLILLEKEIDTVESNLNRIEKLKDKQLATITDYLKAKSRFDTLIAKRIIAKNDIQIAQENLAELVGELAFLPLASMKSNIDISILIPKENFDQTQSKALEANPIILQYEAAVASEDSSYKAALGAHSPKLSLRIQGQSSNIGYDNIQTTETDSTSATLLLQVPLFSGGSTSASQYAAHQKLLMAKEDLKSIKRHVRKQVRTAYQTLTSIPERLKASSTLVESATTAKLSSEKSFTHGLTNIVDILERTEDLYDALVQKNQIYYDAMSASITLKYWSGDLNRQHLELINSMLN